jgi:hypothetical protein
MIALGFAIGAAVGWANRPVDLLAASDASAASSTPPGLWMDPRWKNIAKANSAEDQYHFAQVRANPEEQEAAWLAVPGHHPASREWVARAYTQFARMLLLRRDSERLQTLGEELDHWAREQTHEKRLASVIRAGVKALDSDIEGVLADFDQTDPSKFTDPALLGLSLDVVARTERATRDPEAPGNSVLARERLRGMRQKLLTMLFKTGLRDPLFVRLRSD